MSAGKSGQGGAKNATILKITGAAGLYKKSMIIQNTANLQWSANDPANAEVRDEFRLNTFPLANHAPPKPTPPAMPAK